MNFNSLELYSFIALPLAIAAFGVVVGFLYGRGGDKPDRDLRPGE